MAVSRAREAPPPLGDGRVFFLVSIHLGVGCVAMIGENRQLVTDELVEFEE